LTLLLYIHFFQNVRLQKDFFIIIFFITNVFIRYMSGGGVTVMTKLKKIICLTLLISVCLFPTSAFAASNFESSNNKKSLISSILSIFSGNKSSGNTSQPPLPSIPNNVKDFNTKSWYDWFNHKNWWDDLCKWDKYKDDSYKLWERYYCY
jgi:hypothetical protein